MSYIGIILTSVFAANALLVYGFGASRMVRHDARGLLPTFAALALVGVLSALILWALRHFLLAPFGLISLEALIYAVLIVPLIKYSARAAASGRSGFVRKTAAAADDYALSSLVFGIALIVTRRDYGLPEALVAALASSLGYAAALLLLDAIRERLELSSLPHPFRGGPALLISAGLMAMAFMGIDAVLIKNLVG